MNGWVSVAIIVAAQIAVAVFAVRLAARRWCDYALIAAMTAALLRPTAIYVAGDISRYLPGGIRFDGADFKDRIIDADIASTILLPLIAVAVLVHAVRCIWRSSPTGSRQDAS